MLALVDHELEELLRLNDGVRFRSRNFIRHFSNFVSDFHVLLIEHKFPGKGAAFGVSNRFSF